MTTEQTNGERNVVSCNRDLYFLHIYNLKNAKTTAERMEAVLQMRTCQREKTRGCASSVRKMKIENDGDV